MVNEACANAPYNVCDFCQPLGSCPLTVIGGGVTLVPARVNGRPPVIPGVPAPAIFALSQGRVAVAPARSPSPEGESVLRTAEDGPVVVNDLTGRLLLRVDLQGIVRDIALSGPTLAILLEQPDGSKLILRFDVPSGKSLGSTRVALAAQDLATAAGGTIFRVRRDIHLLGPKGLRLLQRASGTPIGLSIEGRRISWAGNIKGRGRIVALTLPR